MFISGSNVILQF